VLASEGLVRTTQGRGTFVEARPLAYPIGARTRFSEIVARGGRDPGGVLLGTETHAAEAGLAEALGVPAGSPILTLITLRSADGAPISFARSHFPLPRFAGLDAMVAAGTNLSEALVGYGVGDYRRVRTRVTGRPATAEEATRLELAPGRVLLVVDSINADAAGTPIQATTSLFAADRVEIVVES
jgi:GntR family phosphonate transport system transcriptional regulator